MRKISLLLALVASFCGSQAFADFTAKDASGSTITFKNATTCTSGVCVPQAVIVDGNGASVLGTTADSVCSTSTGTCSLMALIKFFNQTAAAAIPAGTNVIGYTTNDPCSGNTTKSSTPISQTTSGQIVPLGSGKKNYICSIAFVVPDTETVSFVEGTGQACVTSTAALIGSTIAASGLAFTANNGMTLGNGAAFVAAGTNSSFNICLLQSGTGRISGVMTYVQQ